ncbi:MAG: ATP-binding protein [Chitinophagaceae bacterium]|nr:ATP-binding protein [Chitinophagaceae bacterium]
MSYQYELLSDQYHFQDFLADLFNEKFQTNSFETYRSSGHKQFGVDVYSSLKKIAVQAKKKDIHRPEKKLIEELLADLDETVKDISKFPHEINTVYFATSTKKFPEVQDRCLQLSKQIGKTIHFFSWHEIQSEIHQYTSIRNKYYPHLASKIFPKQLVMIPVLDTQSVIGRRNEISQLKTLFETNSIVSVESIGGIGKSTFTKLFYQENSTDYDHLAWIDYLTDFKKDIALNESLANSLQLSFTEDDSIEKRYQSILMAFNSLKGKILIVIDNLQHQADINVEQEIRKLSNNSGIQVLVSSRQRFIYFSTFQLPLLSQQEAKAVFRIHCSKPIDDQKLDLLMDQIDRNTLLIQLLAKTIQQSVELTIDQVLHQLSQHDLETYELNIEIDYSTDTEQVSDKIYSLLKKLFAFTSLHNDESLALHVMAIVPSSFLSIKEVLDFFNYQGENRTKMINAINNLHKKGWLERNGDEVRMHRLLQDIVRIQASGYFIYMFIINGLLYVLKSANTAFSTTGYRLQQYAESVLSKLKGPKTQPIFQPLFLLKNNLYIAYRYLGEKEKAEALMSEMINDLPQVEKLPFNDQLFMARLFHNMGIHFMDRGEFGEAEKYLLKALDHYPDPPTDTIIHTHTALYSIYSKRGDAVNAMKYTRMSMDYLQKNQNEENDHLIASVFNTLATLYLQLNDLDQAAAMIHEAIIWHRESKSKDKTDAALADIYSNAAVIYTSAKRFDTAILFAQNAIQRRENLQLENDKRLIELYLLLAEVLHQAGEKDKAAQIREAFKEVETHGDEEGV